MVYCDPRYQNGRSRTNLGSLVHLRGSPQVDPHKLKLLKR